MSLIWQEKQILVFVNKDEELSHPDTDILCKKWRTRSFTDILSFKQDLSASATGSELVGDSQRKLIRLHVNLVLRHILSGPLAK